MKKTIICTASLLLLLPILTACGSDDAVSDAEASASPQIIDTYADSDETVPPTDYQNYEESQPPETDEDSYDYDLEADRLPINPDSLINTGGNLLVDSTFNYSVQFPEGWFFRDSVTLQAEHEATLEYLFEMDFADIVETYPHLFYPFPFPHSATITTAEQPKNLLTELGNHIPEIGVAVLYWQLPRTFTIDEVALLSWEWHNARLESIGGRLVNETAFVGELERVYIDGVAAYRFMSRLDIHMFDFDVIGADGIPQEGEDWVEVAYVYLIPLSDDVYARFSLVMPDEIPEVIEAFRTAMESFTWMQ